MVKTKVFVGNLSFRTQERDLAKEFEQAGKVASANIITRGTRSLGYGFVEMESEEDAHKAVELLNKKNIDGREINVEVAKIREETTDAAGAATGAAPGGATRGRGRARGGAASGRGAATEGGAPGANAGAGAPARRGGRGGGRGRAPRAQGEGGDAAPAGGAAAGNGAPAPRRPRPPRAPRSEEDKTPRAESATTLFVANLPFSVDDSGLAKIFEGLNLKTAHVVRKRNERSKGFGFVEFNNAEDQHKALAVNNKEVDGRQLIVKIALTEVPTAGGDAAPAPTPAPAQQQ